MSQRVYCFIVVLILTFKGEVFAQNVKKNNRDYQKSLEMFLYKKVVFSNSTIYAIPAGDELYFNNQRLLKEFDFGKKLCENCLTRVVITPGWVELPKTILTHSRMISQKDSAWLILKTDFSFNRKTLNVTSGSFYVNNLGFFCKKELQLDKLTPLPVRFRLGSLEYVNWLEQKPNARRY